MKKIIVVVLLAAAAGCAPMDRVNPTDPVSGNTEYGGWNYITSAAGFSSASDFVISGSYMYCADSFTNTVYRFPMETSAYDASWSGSFVLPTGIAAVENAGDTTLFVADKNSGQELKKFNVDAGGNVSGEVSASPAHSCDKLAVNGTVLAVAQKNLPHVYLYNTSFSAGADWAINTWNCVSCLEEITDIEIAGDGNIVLADSVKNRVAVFTGAGVFVEAVDISYDIEGIGVRGSTVFIPAKAGILMYSYPGLVYSGSIADWGDGSGKVTEEGLAEAPPGYVLAGAENGTVIKYFSY